MLALRVLGSDETKRSFVLDVHTSIVVVSTSCSAVLRAVFMSTHAVVVSCNARLCYNDVDSSSCAVEAGAGRDCAHSSPQVLRSPPAGTAIVCLISAVHIASLLTQYL